MTAAVEPPALQSMLHDGGEIALVDVREHGEYGAEHLLFCTSIPLSRFELDLPRLVPNPVVRLVLYDGGGDALAYRAAEIAEALGYANVGVLAGGLATWRAAGFRTFAGLHVPSKAFGELVEYAFATPSISAAELAEQQRRGAAPVVLDGRPWEEYRAMNIPGSISCPNGELIYRLGELVPDARTPIVINCAGRTRSIIGCETLRQFGVPNPVYALRNGTMGWRLAGLELEHGSARRASAATPVADLEARRARAIEVAERAGVGFAPADVVREWLADGARTTYLLDIRDPREYREAHLQGAACAPGGQLIQATDRWIGVRGARLLLVDDTEARAAVCGFWLAQMGHEVAVLAGGADSWWEVETGASPMPPPAVEPAARITAAALAEALSAARPPTLLDTQRSMEYRKAHAPQARWVIRPALEAAIGDIDLRADPVRLIGRDDGSEDLLAADLARLGAADIAVVDGGYSAWQAAGFPLKASPGEPADRECIDYLFFVHDRHAGNLEAAERYLAWEQGLVENLDTLERRAFSLVAEGGEAG